MEDRTRTVSRGGRAPTDTAHGVISEKVHRDYAGPQPQWVSARAVVHVLAAPSRIPGAHGGGSTTVTTYQDKGTYTVSGSTIQFRSPGVGTFAGTLSGTTLTAAYPYCGATHTLVFQQQ